MTPGDLERAVQFGEQFNSLSERAHATHDLAALGAAAVPVLGAIFSGAARNQFGVAYRDTGQPLLCSFVTAGLLGTLARDLEPYLRAGVQSGHVYAVDAIARIGPISEGSIQALAQCLREKSLIAMEAAAALKACGELSNPIVTAVVASNAYAARVVERASSYRPRGR